MAFTRSIEELIADDTSGLLSKHDSWQRIRLGDVAKVLNGYAFSSSYFNSAGKGLPLIRIRDVVSGKTNTFYDGEYGDEYLIFDGDLLVGMDGDFNSAFWRSGRALLNQRVCKISSESKHYSFLFLAYLLPHYLNAVHQQTSSITVKHLSSNTINNLLLPLPPKNEQVRIVEKLEELLSDLDNGIAELKAAQIKLTQYRQSSLKSAVEGSLTQEWREVNTHKITETGEQLLSRILKARRARWEQQKLEEFSSKNQTPPKDWQKKYPEPVKPDTSDLPELPDGWVWASVDQLAEIGTGVTPLKSRSDFYHNGTIPWVTSGAVNDEIVTQSGTLVTMKAIDECRLKMYPIGTLLVAMYGEGKTRGKCSELGIAATINQALAALVLEGASFQIKDFLKIFLLDSYQRMRAKASGGVQPNLNLLIVRSMCVPLPPLKEQSEICLLVVQQRNDIDSQKKAVDFGLQATEAQRKNLLKDAFSGTLVPQDPHDEPASVLLEKIKSERVARLIQSRPKQVKKKDNNKANIMETLFEVLKANGDWMDAQEVFELCGVAKNTSTDKIELLYLELRDHLQSNIIEVKRDGNKDRLRLIKVA